MIGLILSALALGGMLIMPQLYQARIESISYKAELAERNYTLVKMEIEGFKKAMIAHGVKDLNPHLPGEPD